MESGIRRYQRIAPMFILLGLAAIFLTALILFLRQNTLESLAQLFFIPILFGVIYFGLKGGLVSAVLMALAYGGIIFLRGEALPFSLRLSSLIIRAVFFVVMGVAGGLLFDRLKVELKEIEERVLLDRASGLFTVRYFITSLQKEIDRAKRYKKPFAVALFKVEAPFIRQGRTFKVSLNKLNPKLGEIFREAARIVDTMALCDPGEIGVVLPETPKEGGEKFVGRVRPKILSLLQSLGVESPQENLSIDTYNFPEDEKKIQALIENYASKIEVSYIKRPREYKK